jgi:hypothetical protein
MDKVQKQDSSKSSELNFHSVPGDSEGTRFDLGSEQRWMRGVSLTNCMERSPSCKANNLIHWLVKKFAVFYGRKWFITVFTRALHLPLSRAI